MYQEPNSKKIVKKVIRTINYRLRHLLAGKIEINTLNFIDETMQLKLIGRGVKNKDHDYQLVLKDMSDSKNTYKYNGVFVNSNELLFDVNLTTISKMFAKEHSKWSLFIAINNVEIRLSTDRKLRDNMQRHYIKDDKFELTIEPYITKHGNLSLNTINLDESAQYETGISTKLIGVKDLPNFAEKVIHHSDGISIEGWAEIRSEVRKHVSLLVRKRGSTLQYEVPLTWHDEESWGTKVDINLLESLRGTYDYYLLLDDGRAFRMKLHKKAVVDSNPLFRKSEIETRELSSYRTKKDSLSLICKISNIPVQKLTGNIKDDVVTLQWEIGKSDMPKHKLNNYQIVLRQRDTNEISEFPIKVNATKDGYDLKFHMDYKKLIPNDQLQNFRWDIYLQLNIDGYDQLLRLLISKDCETDSLAYDTRKKIENENIYQIFFYRTIHNHLSISFSSLTINRDLYSYRVKNKKLCLNGYAYLEAINFNKKNMLKRFIVLRNRETDLELVLPLENIVSKQKLSESGFNYKFAGFYAEIPLETICELQQNNKDILDLYIQIHYKNEVVERKLGLNRFTYYKDDYYLKYNYIKNDNYFKNYLTLTPRGNLKIESYSYSKEMNRYIKYGVHFDRLKNKNKDVWIIGERPDTAQDTGYHFFRYCRERYPEKQIYYAIDKKSPDLKNIKELGNILYLGSFEHLKISLIATTFIGSHDLEYILPVKSRNMKNYKRGKRIFLQHGVLGRKNVEYHKRFYIDPFQMFCVSSESEKELVKNDFGYKNHEVKITGLSRFDALLNERKEERSILLIPTWREWLNTEDNFIESEYFERYKGLITNERLLTLLNEHNVNLNVYPHYRMQHFINHFESLETNRVKIIELGEKNVQDLLMENQLMITDYSSVSFDFNYMSKPIVFYHFDSDTFFKNGILRPIEETFLGDICNIEDGLIDSIEYYLVNDFNEKQGVTEKKHLVFDQIDSLNCERIFSEIINMK